MYEISLQVRQVRVLCLDRTCPIGKSFFGNGNGLCPALTVTEVATCGLVGRSMELDFALRISAGCCIKARAYKDGVEYDFAALPKEMKMMAVRQKMKGR